MYKKLSIYGIVCKTIHCLSKMSDTDLDRIIKIFLLLMFCMQAGAAPNRCRTEKYLQMDI